MDNYTKYKLLNKKSTRRDLYMESLTLGQYRQMVEDILDFKKINGEMPDYTIVNDCRIDKEEYIDMIERVNRFFLEIGRNPRMVEIDRTPVTKTEKVLVH